jgi:diadenosine tetraphosphate (Ap4A) HIT family hydrolase
MYNSSLGRQLELAPDRKEYRQEANAKRAAGFCYFCDQETLAGNCIVSEDTNNNIRVMMNKKPYFPFYQGQHLLFMPMVHVEDPDSIPEEYIKAQCDEVQKWCAIFYDDAYHQEIFTNWGQIAGQSVAHWHSHIKNYTQVPNMSIPELLRARETPRITTIEQAFSKVKELLAPAPLYKPVQNIDPKKKNNCLCCKVGERKENDQENLVIDRFLYNYVVISHWQTLPAELSVVPFHHASSIKDLSQEIFHENMVIATALMKKLQAYADPNVRTCTGGNLHITSMGAKAKEKHKENYHAHTRVMPRTIIVATTGIIVGTSCKLDDDPIRFYKFMKNIIAELVD